MMKLVTVMYDVPGRQLEMRGCVSSKVFKLLTSRNRVRLCNGECEVSITVCMLICIWSSKMLLQPFSLEGHGAPAW